MNGRDTGAFLWQRQNPVAKTQPQGYIQVMPTVKHDEGFAIKVNTRGEHSPPHVHVIKAGSEIRVKLGDEEAAPSYWDEKRPMAVKDKVRAVLLVDKYQAECLAVWRKFNANLR